MNCKNLDDHIEGTFDPNHPANQPESENIIESVTDALMIDDKEMALEILEELFKDVQRLREYAKNNENVYLEKRLTEIYNKL